MTDYKFTHSEIILIAKEALKKALDSNQKHVITEMKDYLDKLYDAHQQKDVEKVNLYKSLINESLNQLSDQKDIKKSSDAKIFDLAKQVLNWWKINGMAEDFYVSEDIGYQLINAMKVGDELLAKECLKAILYIVTDQNMVADADKPLFAQVERVVEKSLSAGTGSYNAAPSSLTSGAALQTESLDGEKKRKKKDDDVKKSIIGKIEKFLDDQGV